MIPFKHIHSPLTKSDLEFLAEEMKLSESEVEEDERNPNIKIKKSTITFLPLLRAMLRCDPEIEDKYLARNEYLDG
jgi:hypothetical protein